MRKELIETGKTVDAAIEAACVKLGCEREDCEWEIIDLPKKAFLGLKTFPAKVRVAVVTPDPERQEKEEKAKPASKPAQASPVASKPKSAEAKPAEVKAEPIKPAQPQTPDVSRNAAPSPEPLPEKKEAFTEEADFFPRVAVTGDYTEKETIAVEYISAIVRDFGLEAKFDLFREQGGICIDITGDGMGSVIGRRGETLDAIQYLTGLVVNRMEGDYTRITVDCGDYRTKRKETLEALAKKLAVQVMKTNVSKTLEPMNPFERRVIHATVSKIEGVTSSSIGEEPNRKVIITTPTSRRPAVRAGYSHDSERRPRPASAARGPDRSRDRGPDRDKRNFSRSARPQPSPAPQGPPKETPESAAIGNAPIGKLDLE